MATATAVSVTSTHPLKWLAAPSSCSTNASALRRASSLMTTGSPDGCWPLIRGLRSLGVRRQPADDGPDAGDPHHQPVAVLAELQEGVHPAAQAQRLRRPHGHPEDDLAQDPRHGVPVAGGGDAEVLAHRRARALHGPEG